MLMELMASVGRAPEPQRTLGALDLPSGGVEDAPGGVLRSYLGLVAPPCFLC